MNSPAAEWRAWAQRIGHWLLPPQRFVREAQDSHFRAVVLMSFALLSAALMLLMAALEWTFDVPELGVVLLAMGVGLFVLAASFRSNAGTRLHGNLVAGCIYAGSFLLVWMSGGRAVGVLTAGPIFVLLCTLSLRGRDALVWCAVAVGVVLYAASLAMSGASAPFPPRPEWLQNAPFRVPALLNLLAAGIGFLIVAAYARMRSRLDRAQHELDQTLLRARRQERRFEDFAALVGDHFWETDAHLRLVHMSSGFAEAFGVEPQTVMGRTPSQVAAELFPAAREPERAIDPMQAREPFRDQRLIWRDAVGRYHEMLNHGVPVHDEHGEFLGYRGVIVDRSQSYRLNRELRQRAETDALTGLSNRRAFAARYEARRDEPHSLSDWLLFLDLDQFKQVNDRAGHAAGDRLLQTMARLFRECVRQSDEVVRMGGDEFLLFVLDADPVQAEAVVTRLRTRTADLCVSDPAFGPIGISIGKVQVPQPAPPLDHILRIADAACYADKHARRDASS